MRSETLWDPFWEQQIVMAPESDAVGSGVGAVDGDEVGDAVGSDE